MIHSSLEIWLQNIDIDSFRSENVICKRVIYLFTIYSLQSIFRLGDGIMEISTTICRQQLTETLSHQISQFILEERVLSSRGNPIAVHSGYWSLDQISSKYSYANEARVGFCDKGICCLLCRHCYYVLCDASRLFGGWIYHNAFWSLIGGLQWIAKCHIQVNVLYTNTMYM